MLKQKTIILILHLSALLGVLEKSICLHRKCTQNDPFALKVVAMPQSQNKVTEMTNLLYVLSVIGVV